MRKYLPLLLLAFSVPALAHPGHGTDSFQAGFLHPLTGLDHLLMLTGAGVLSALSGRKLLLPLATLGMMLAGAVAGSLLGGFSGMEMLIIASLALCGVMMFKTENRLLLAVPALAMFHGWAHGVEMSGHSFWLFTSGFMLASATVLCASFAAGLLLRRHDGLRRTLRWRADRLCPAGADELMEHARQRLRLMQLSSSSLPVGSFTWSQGLEWAVEAGWVTDAEAFRRWQIQQMEQSFFCVDLPLFIRLYRACEKQDVATAKRWTAYLLACRETRELRDEERNRGAAFTRLIKSWEPACPPEWLPLLTQSQLCGMAWLGVRWGIQRA